LEITCRRLGLLTILDLRGQCAVSPDEAETTALRSTIRRLVAEGWVHVVANLAALKSVDARGLGELVLTHQTLEAAGGELTLVAPNAAIRKMLAVTRLDTILRLCDSESEMVRRFFAAIGRDASLLRRDERRPTVVPATDARA
jgi:anti-anti-sigma factor